jgi:UDP-glucuronate 4-epimerase
MRALVTGCAGFIGSHLADSLLADGHSVLGIDCFNDNYRRAPKLANLQRARDYDAFEFVPIDLARGDLAELVEECEVIFHLAAEPGVRSSWGERFELFVRNNVLATQRLLEAAAGDPSRRFVYASSSSIYGNAETVPTPEPTIPAPYSPYGVTKLAGEHLCQLYRANHSLETVSLRYFTVYGPRQRPDMALHRFCAAAIAGDPITIFGDGNQLRDFTFVHDVVAATRAAAIAPHVPSRIYNIGGGCQVSLARVLELLAGIAARPLDIRYADSEAGDVRETSADTTRAAAELGYRPSVSFEDGLRAEFTWALERRAEEAVRPRLAGAGGRR